MNPILRNKQTTDAKARGTKTTAAVGGAQRNPRTAQQERKSRVAASQRRDLHALLRRYAALPVFAMIRGFREDSSPTATVVSALRACRITPLGQLREMV